ncbi:MAG: epimerase, partial [Verrucomicrobiae bacterium]|nr:epimerase [Verrucomicrobiae bacterium]
GSRIVALSTGNVYPMVPVASGGATEDTPLQPLGEYPNAAISRERLFEYHARIHATPLVLLRLNYAVELRYGVVHDLALRIWRGEPVELANGWFNCIWQGDANELILRALSLTSSPPAAWNLSSPKPVSVREVAHDFGRLLEKPVQLTGAEAGDALLANTSALCERLGEPATPIDRVSEWIAHWVRNGGPSLNKPTGFEVRDGRY